MFACRAYFLYTGPLGYPPLPPPFYQRGRKTHFSHISTVCCGRRFAVSERICSANADRTRGSTRVRRTSRRSRDRKGVHSRRPHPYHVILSRSGLPFNELPIREESYYDQVLCKRTSFIGILPCGQDDVLGTARPAPFRHSEPNGHDFQRTAHPRRILLRPSIV